MSNFYTLISLATITAALTLSGCQQFTHTPLTTIPSLNPGQNQFSLEGKIGVRTPQQSGSAYFTWVQNQAQFSLQINGALGVGKTIIEGQPGQVSLNSAKTGLITAASPEELLEQATGWVAPITYLVDWVQARPATPAAQLQRDDSNRIIQIQEQDWLVDLSYLDAATLPNRLILKQQLEDGQENRITLVIQNR